VTRTAMIAAASEEELNADHMNVDFGIGFFCGWCCGGAVMLWLIIRHFKPPIDD
jgi:hypothetical protein